MLLACDERNIVVSDLGSPKYFDTTVAYKTLIQNCGPKSPGSFSITVKENEEAGSNSAVCTEEGCTFK